MDKDIGLSSFLTTFCKNYDFTILSHIIFLEYMTFNNYQQFTGNLNNKQFIYTQQEKIVLKQETHIIDINIYSQDTCCHFVMKQKYNYLL